MYNKIQEKMVFRLNLLISFYEFGDDFSGTDNLANLADILDFLSGCVCVCWHAF